VQEPSETELEIMAAERAVDDARNKLVAELEAVSETGKEAVLRVVHKARPLAIATAAVAGVAVLAGTVVLVRNSLSRRRTRYYFGPTQPSFFGQLARRALMSAAGSLAAMAAQRLLASAADGEPAALPAPSHANGRAPKKARETAAKAAAR
jgi:hypothetical protein